MLPALPPALLRYARSSLLPALSELVSSNPWASSQPYATDAEAASPATSREHILSRLGSTLGQQRAGPRAPRRPQQSVPANAGGWSRGGAPTPLSPGMESLKMGFFQVVNSAPGSTSAQHKQLCIDAVAGLLHVLQEGMQQAKPSTQGGVGTLPRDFWADKELFNHAFTVLAKCYELPIDNFGRSEYRLRPDQRHALDAAQKMKALCAAMEATPSIRIDSWHVDYMLCAWRFAGKPDEVKALLDRHLEHADAGSSFPRFDGLRHAFFALKESFDVEGMWSLMSSLASKPELLHSPLFILVPRFVHMLVIAAAQGRRWDIVNGVQLLMRQLRSSREGQQLSMSYSARVMVMAHAAQDDQLHVVRDMLELVAQETKALPAEYIQQRRRQQELQELRASESGQSSSSTSSSLAEGHRVRSKVNEGVLLEVLHACARAPDTSEAKALARKAFETLEQTLPVSNYHPPAYYMQLMGTSSEAEQQELPPPAPRAFSTPPVAAHHALIHVLARAGDWPALFDMVARLEKMVEEGLARPASLSVHRGLGCAAEGVAQASAGVKAAAASAYNVLTLRQASGQLVSCAMMNVVLRGLALGGEVDACGRLFEEYKVAGLPHDFAAYNSVIESCCVAKKPQAAYGVLDYMATQNVKPGTDSYDLLLRAFVSAGDVDGALEALRRGRADNARTRYGPIQAALSLARRKGNAAAMREFSDELMALDAREREQQTQLLQQQQQQQQLRQQQEALMGRAPDTAAAAAAAGAAAAGVGAYEQVQAGLAGYDGYEQGDATGVEQGAEYYEAGLQGDVQAGEELEGEVDQGGWGDSGVEGQVLEDEVAAPLEEEDGGGGGFGMEGSGFEDDDRL